MKAITIEELKAKFVVARVAPYGEVIMVPGADFDPDWESVLEEEGFGCVFTEINSEKFTLVKLEKEEDEETAAEPSHVPKSEDSGQFSGKRRSGALPGQKMIHWSDADKERLLKRIEEMPRTITFEDKCAQLVSEFPGRTGIGLEKKYQKLMRGKKRRSIGRPKKRTPGETVEVAPKGDIEGLPRESEEQQDQRLQDANKEQVLADASIPMEHVSAETVAAATASNWAAKTLAGLVAHVQALSDEMKMQHDIIRRLDCAIVMQALETLERQGHHLIPPNLRQHYYDALLDDDPKSIATFHKKARLLVEASS